MHAGIAQLVEQRNRNPPVGGSSPLAGSNNLIIVTAHLAIFMWAVISFILVKRVINVMLKQTIKHPLASTVVLLKISIRAYLPIGNAYFLY